MFVYFCSFVGVSITFSYFLSKEIVNEIFVWLYCFYSIAFTKKHNRYTEAVSFIMTEVFFHIQWQMQMWIFIVIFWLKERYPITKRVEWVHTTFCMKMAGISEREHPLMMNRFLGGQAK